MSSVNEVHDSTHLDINNVVHNNILKSTLLDQLTDTIAERQSLIEVVFGIGHATVPHQNLDAEILIQLIRLVQFLFELFVINLTRELLLQLGVELRTNAQNQLLG